MIEPLDLPCLSFDHESLDDDFKSLRHDWLRPQEIVTGGADTIIEPSSSTSDLTSLSPLWRYIMMYRQTSAEGKWHEHDGGYHHRPFPLVPLTQGDTEPWFLTQIGRRLTAIDPSKQKILRFLTSCTLDDVYSPIANSPWSSHSHWPRHTKSYHVQPRDPNLKATWTSLELGKRKRTCKPQTSSSWKNLPSGNH